MEQDKQKLLEMIDRPAFLVRDGIITQANQMAKNRQIVPGTPISQLIPEDCSAYQEYSGGCLYLTVYLGAIPCGASVTRQLDGDIFLLDRDFDHSQLQVLALAAQQLRVPLSNVMTIADRLFPELDENTSQKEQAAQMTRGLFQLMRVISNMADAERYTDTDSPRMENTELKNYFREIFQKAESALERTDVMIKWSTLDRNCFSMIDRERLERAVNNLLSNAVKFSPTGGIVTVSVVRTDNRIRLTVADQGDGVASHAHGSLFARYQREPGIEDSRFGLGLGMTLVRSVAAMHAGTVLVDEYNGTRVTMTLSIRTKTPGNLLSPPLRIGDYAGGRDLGLLEFAEVLPVAAYEPKN